MSKCLWLPGFEGLGENKFGGLYLKGNAREQRPISARRPLHMVMRSTHAKGALSFLAPGRARRIRSLVDRIGKAKGVKIYRYSNAGNHLHMVILPKTRNGYAQFARAVTGVIARMTLGAQKGRPKDVKFWDAKPFTRIIEWGRDFRAACAYVLQNTLEAIGFIPYTPRTYRGTG